MKNYILTFFLMCGILFVNAQNDSISKNYIEDFNTFIQLLEETHPDPYSVFGGKMEFRKVVQNTRTVLQKATNKHEFSQQLSNFIAQLEDGHTFIFSNENSAKNKYADKYFPIVFNVATDGLFVHYTSDQYTSCVGNKLLAINQIPIDSLLQKMKRISSTENIYGAMLALRNRIANQLYAAELLNDLSVVTLTLQDSNGNIHTVDVFYNENPTWAYPKSQIEIEKDNNLLYGSILKDTPNVAYWAWNGMVSHEVLKSMDTSNTQYQNIFKWALNLTGIKKIESEEQSVEQVPELYSTFATLLEEMKKHKTEYLIIDLRQNSGGMTPLCFPLLYMLYGDKYLTYKSKAQYNQLLSPLLLQKWNMKTIEEYNRANNTNYVLGDYIFSNFHDFYDTQTIEEKRKNRLLISYKNGIGKEYTENLNGKPIYEPHVIVLSSPQTFSAAYHFMYYLSEIGNATVVGVPSSQAGNAFMETTSFELSHTKIKGSISNARQIMFPDDEERGSVFIPDFPMNRNDFAKYNFDKDAELQYCLYLIKAGRLERK